MLFDFKESKGDISIEFIPFSISTNKKNPSPLLLQSNLKGAYIFFLQNILIEKKKIKKKGVLFKS